MNVTAYMPKSGWDAVWKSLKNRQRARVYSGSGFRVHWKSTWDLEYEENEHLLRLGVGIAKVGPKWWQTINTIEFPLHLGWEYPFSNEAIPSSKRDMIANRVSEAFRYFEVPHRVLSDSER